MHDVRDAPLTLPAAAGYCYITVLIYYCVNLLRNCCRSAPTILCHYYCVMLPRLPPSPRSHPSLYVLLFHPHLTIVLAVFLSAFFVQAGYKLLLLAILLLLTSSHTTVSFTTVLHAWVPPPFFLGWLQARPPRHRTLHLCTHSRAIHNTVSAL